MQPQSNGWRTEWLYVNLVIVLCNFNFGDCLALLDFKTVNFWVYLWELIVLMLWKYEEPVLANSII